MFQCPFRFGRCRGFPVIVLLTAMSCVQAQGPAPRSERADPLDAQARVPAAKHSSSLSSYRRLGDDKRVDWKAANETVNRIGGWRTYTREAQQPDPEPAAPAVLGAPVPASGAASAPGSHKAH